MKDGKFKSETFGAICTLKSSCVVDKVMESYVRKSLLVGLCLLKKSTFFGKTDDLPNMDDYIIQNEDVKMVNGFAVSMHFILLFHFHFLFVTVWFNFVSLLSGRSVSHHLLVGDNVKK